MTNYLHGDVPKEHLELADELEALETFFNEKAAVFTPQLIARGYTSIAYDWYAMGCEEKGSALLDKADKICPGYFDHQIYVDMKDDPDFNLLVKGMTANILLIAKGYVESKS